MILREVTIVPLSYFLNTVTLGTTFRNVCVYGFFDGNQIKSVICLAASGIHQRPIVYTGETIGVLSFASGRLGTAETTFSGTTIRRGWT